MEDFFSDIFLIKLIARHLNVYFKMCFLTALLSNSFKISNQTSRTENFYWYLETRIFIQAKLCKQEKKNKKKKPDESNMRSAMGFVLLVCFIWYMQRYSSDGWQNETLKQAVPQLPGTSRQLWRAAANAHFLAFFFSPDETCSLSAGEESHFIFKPMLYALACSKGKQTTTKKS